MEMVISNNFHHDEDLVHHATETSHPTKTGCLGYKILTFFFCITTFKPHLATIVTSILGRGFVPWYTKVSSWWFFQMFFLIFTSIWGRWTHCDLRITGDFGAHLVPIIAGWWFQICFMCILIWGNDPIWLAHIFQMGGSTTNLVDVLVVDFCWGSRIFNL